MVMESVKLRPLLNEVRSHPGEEIKSSDFRHYGIKCNYKNLILFIIYLINVALTHP